MDLNSYQDEAWRYDQHPESRDKGLVVALLGLGGEVGTLQTTQKKVIRDGTERPDTGTNAVEDLGDILWYVADTATWLGYDLQEVAARNLEKIAGRWAPHDEPRPVRSDEPLPTDPHPFERRPPELPPARLFDGPAKDGESFPRQLTIHLAEITGTDQRVLPVWNGAPCGNQLGDNSYDADGYRWHDCLHMGYLAVLGWSPVLRSLMNLKRKSDFRIDDVEDGGRAVAKEEGIAAMVFEAAERAGFYEHIRVVDAEVLRTCIRVARGQQVAVCTAMEWEAAILGGFDAWRTVKDAGHGAITLDLDARTISARPLTDDEIAAHAVVAAGVLAKQAAEKAARAAQETASAQEPSERQPPVPILEGRTGLAARQRPGRTA